MGGMFGGRTERPEGQQEEPDHSAADLHLVFGLFLFFQSFPCPVITWSSKDSRSSMSLFSLSGREKGEFSADPARAHRERM